MEDLSDTSNEVPLHEITFTTLWANSADDKLMIFFLFFSENRLWPFMQIVSKWDNLHQRSKLIFWEKKKIISKCFETVFREKYFKMSSTEFWMITFVVILLQCKFLTNRGKFVFFFSLYFFAFYVALLFFFFVSLVGEKKSLKETRAGVCKTLCPQLPDSNTVWLQHCLAMTVTTVQIYDFNVILSKGNNSKIGDDWDKKKIRITYFFMRNQNMKFQNISIHGSKLMLYTIKQRH